MTGLSLDYVLEPLESMQTWICQLLFPVVNPTTSATVVFDLFQLTHDTTLAGLQSDICHLYGPVADNGNKKAWMELLVELKKPQTSN